MEEQLKELMTFIKKNNEETEIRRQQEKDELKQILDQQEKQRQQDKEEQEKQRQREKEEQKDELKYILDQQRDEMRQIINQLETSRQEEKKEFRQILLEQEIKEQERFNVIMNQVEQNQVDMENKISQVEDKVQEEVQKVKQDFDNKLQLMENKIYQMKQSTSPDVRRQSSKHKEDSSYSSKIKAPSFDGKQSWTTYHKQFEAAATAGGWTDEEKATALILALRGEALDILHSVSESEQQSYATLTERLEMRYGNRHLQQVYQAQLKNKQQRPSETLQQYESEIVRLVRLAYPTAPKDFLDRLMVQTFIDGIRDIEIQQTLRLGNPKKIEDALARALEFEAAKQASRSHLRVRQTRIYPGKDEISVPNKTQQTEKLLEVIEQLKALTVIPEKSRVCWNCGVEGHFKRDCPKIPQKETTKNQEN